MSPKPKTPCVAAAGRRLRLIAGGAEPQPSPSPPFPAPAPPPEPVRQDVKLEAQRAAVRYLLEDLRDRDRAADRYYREAQRAEARWELEGQRAAERNGDG